MESGQWTETEALGWHWRDEQSGRALAGRGMAEGETSCSSETTVPAQCNEV